MVKSITNLTRNGLTDWFVQRVSAIVVAAYVLFLIGYFLTHANVSFNEWQHLFSHFSMRIFSLLFILSLVAHAWIGIWTILTDYIKCPIMRGTLQVAVVIALLACLFWGVAILWGVN